MTTFQSPRDDLWEVGVEVSGFTLKALIDTGATTTVAGKELYEHLLELGTPLIASTNAICQADHIMVQKQVFSASVFLTLRGRCFQGELLLLPDFVPCSLLLGKDFVTAAGVQIDGRNNSWKFWDDPQSVAADATALPPIPVFISTVVTQLRADQSDIRLRPDEAKTLSLSQRADVDSLLIRFSDIFKEPSIPANVAPHRIELLPGTDTIAVQLYKT